MTACYEKVFKNVGFTHKNEQKSTLTNIFYLNNNMTKSFQNFQNTET